MQPQIPKQGRPRPLPPPPPPPLLSSSSPLPQLTLQRLPHFCPGLHVGFGGPLTAVTDDGLPGGGGGGGGKGLSSSEFMVGQGPGEYVQVTGVCPALVLVRVTGGKSTLEVRPTVVRLFSSSFLPLIHTTFHTSIRVVVTGGNVMTVLVVTTVVSQVSRNEMVAGGREMVVGLSRDHGGMMSVHGGKHDATGFGSL